MLSVSAFSLVIDMILPKYQIFTKCQPALVDIFELGYMDVDVIDPSFPVGSIEPLQTTLTRPTIIQLCLIYPFQFFFLSSWIPVECSRICPAAQAQFEID